MLTPEQRAMIHVRTFGSAKIIPEFGLGSAVNYVSTRDAVPFIADPIGCLKGVFSDGYNVSFLESNHYPLIDHPLNNDTYRGAVNRVIDDITQQYGGLK
jgi:hypothetical protein